MLELDAPADAATKRLITTFRKHTFAGASPGKYLGRGASSLVFKASLNGQPVAMKVFDPQFLDDNPASIEEERIRRQLKLKDHGHPNLVQIHAAGFSEEANAHYLIMGHCEGETLDKVIEKIPLEQIRPIISQIASAAQFLETKNQIHRDIKPENIIVSPDLSHATLLDLGVILPIGVKGDSHEDTGTLEFVGTSRYSPPEFILRTEDGSPEGWRAITYYQLGAVLYDMIMGRKLFHDKHPKGRLFYAVFLEQPDFSSPNAPGDLVNLARLCLRKKPSERLASVSWEMFGSNYKPTTASDLKRQLMAMRSAVPLAKDVGHEKHDSNKLEAFALSVKDVLLSDSESFPQTSYSLHGENACVVFTVPPSPTHHVLAHLRVILWPSFSEGSSGSSSLAVQTVVGQVAMNEIQELKQSATVVSYEESQFEDTVSRVFLASMLAASHNAASQLASMSVLNLGSYL